MSLFSRIVLWLVLQLGQKLGYWFLQLLDKVTPSQWAAIGVLGSLVFGLLTYLTNLYFKIKEDKRKAARGE